MADDKDMNVIRAKQEECHKYAIKEAKLANKIDFTNIFLGSVDQNIYATAVMTSCLDHGGVEGYKENLSGHGLPKTASLPSSKGLKP